ncbi:MAG TPA: efflux RND transporter permease subunit [Pirellulales bacterium]|nr:efflux RND transporter permease subunit [Pirellulales bacterium]
MFSRTRTWHGWRQGLEQGRPNTADQWLEPHSLEIWADTMPMALAIDRGSEANAPLGREVIGGLSAGLVTTLFIVPCLYSLVVPDDRKPAPG